MRVSAGVVGALLGTITSLTAHGQISFSSGASSLPTGGRLESPRSFYVAFSLFNAGATLEAASTTIIDDDLLHQGWSPHIYGYRFEAINVSTGASEAGVSLDVIGAAGDHVTVPTQQWSFWQGTLSSTRPAGVTDTYSLRFRLYDALCGRGHSRWPSTCLVYEKQLATVTYSWLEANSTSYGVGIAPHAAMSPLPVGPPPIPPGSQPPPQGLSCNPAHWDTVGRRITQVWFGHLGPYAHC